MLTDVNCKAGQPPPWSFQPGRPAAQPALASRPALAGWRWPANWPASRLASFVWDGHYCYYDYHHHHHHYYYSYYYYYYYHYYY